MRFWPWRRRTETQPELTAATPTSGSAAGGDTLTLTVNRLAEITSVQLGAYECTDVVQDGTTVTCTTPAVPAETYDVVALGPGGLSALYFHFTATGSSADALLLETGDYLLLETGDRLLLE